MRVLKIDNHQNKNIISFEAMKPNQFKGIDYAVVRKFKAPVEKFNGMRDFHNWAKNLLYLNYTMEYKSFSYSADIERKIAINKWREFVSSKEQEWLPAKCLLIFNSMMKNLRINNEVVPPVIKENVLEDSITLVDSKLAVNKDMQFDFNKLYRSKLKSYFLNGHPLNYTGWVKIMPKRLEPENYERNVELLKILSNKNWCTKKDAHAKSHLESDEMHIYLEKGYPKLGVRISGCEIQEVQGEKNNSVIPTKYLNELHNYLEDSNYFLSDDMEFMLELSEVMD